MESWHKTLKKCHLGSERNVRADLLIYLLHEVVNSDFRVSRLKIKAGVSRPKLSSYDKNRNAACMSLDLADAVTMVTEQLASEKVRELSEKARALAYKIHSKY